MLYFNSILQQCDIMNELASPLSERALLTSEYFPISDYPNVPTRHHHYFHKERMPKTSLGLIQYLLHMIMWVPFYLQVVPNSHT
jgi:hypothetical protein